MTRPIFGSARIDENGNIYGGRPGDQTGKEVSTQEGYIHPKGWVVLRFKDYAKALKAAAFMKALCASPRVGYNQKKRGTLRAALLKIGRDLKLLKEDVETDCSAAVRECAASAGVDAPNFTTVNEVDVLMATGEFEKVTDAKHTQKTDYWLPGDILVTRTKGHTGIVLTKGSKAVVPTLPPPTDPATPPTPEKGVRVTGKSVNIRTGPGTGYSVKMIAGKGRILEPVEFADCWRPVLIDGQICWISEAYSEVVS